MHKRVFANRSSKLRGKKGGEGGRVFIVQVLSSQSLSQQYWLIRRDAVFAWNLGTLTLTCHQLGTFEAQVQLSGQIMNTTISLQGLKAATKKQKYEKISEKKMATPIEYLCKGFPLEFSTYFQYCRSLRFDDKPDYSYLRKIFRDLFVRQGMAFTTPGLTRQACGRFCSRALACASEAFFWNAGKAVSQGRGVQEKGLPGAQLLLWWLRGQPLNQYVDDLGSLTAFAGMPPQ